MSQYVVPQFIDVEDKILGPITVRQFSIIMVDFLLMFIIYKLTDFALMLILNIPLLIAGIVIGFVKVNGMPFHFFLLNIIQTTRRAGTRVWNKELTDAEIIAYNKVEVPPPPPPKIWKEAPSTSRLADLSLVVNTGGVYHPEE